MGDIGLMEDTQIDAKITELKNLIELLNRKIIGTQHGHNHDGTNSRKPDAKQALAYALMVGG